MIDPVFQAVLRGSLALLLAAAAAHKLRDLPAFRATLRDYDLLPAAAPVLAPLLPAAEAALAVGVLAPATAAVAGLVTAALLAVYAVAIAVNLVRGRRDIDCGCLGPAGARGMRLSWALVLRNAVLVAAALGVALPPTGRALGGVDALSIAAGTLAAALLFHAANALVAMEEAA